MSLVLDWGGVDGEVGGPFGLGPCLVYRVEYGSLSPSGLEQSSSVKVGWWVWTSGVLLPLLGPVTLFIFVM